MEIETKTGGVETPEDKENLEVPGEETPVKEESEIKEEGIELGQCLL